MDVFHCGRYRYIEIEYIQQNQNFKARTSVPSYNSSIPGQYLLIHSCEDISFIPPFASVSETKKSFKGQVDPPYWGDGLSHSLILDFRPSPHDAEHVLQWLHAPQLPSTKKENYENLHDGKETCE